MRAVFILIFFISSFSSLFSQRRIDIAELYSEYAKKENREKFDRRVQESINNLLLSKSIRQEEYIWTEGLNNAISIYYRSGKLKNKIIEGLNNFNKISPKLQYLLLEAAFALYPNDLNFQINKILNETKSGKIFAAAAVYLTDNFKIKSAKDSLASILKNKFGSGNSNQIIKSLEYDLTEDSLRTPPLKDLLKNDYQKGKTIIYSFQRKDRTYPGITIIKKPDGNFVSDEDGAIFYIPHLARSMTNFPGYLKNGNTPEGIYSLVGFYISPTETIGPTPALLIRSPFEVSTEIFYHGKQTSRKWIENDYKNLLPDSWRNYFPIYESFRAGKLGRKLIVSHGSTDDIKYYKNKIYYPITPTKGCVSAKEIWDSAGRCVESDQAKLMNAFFSVKQLYGFFVLVNIDDKQAPVTIEEILPFIKPN